METMNYTRTRKFLSTLSNEELIDLWNHAKDGIEYNSVVAAHLANLELEERKEKAQKEISEASRNPYIEKLFELYMKGVIDEDKLLEKLKECK